MTSVVADAKISSWDKFGEAMEKGLWSASRKFWQKTFGESAKESRQSQAVLGLVGTADLD